MGCINVYDRAAAVAYARKWALTYNPAFPSYKSSKGDCMNFVSQCLNAGGMPMKNQGILWYANASTGSSSWRGVDSFLAYLRKTFGSPRLLYEVLETPERLEKGDIVFTVASGTPGDVSRDPSHIVILSENYSYANKLIVCGHTTDQLDAEKKVAPGTSTYIHILGIEQAYIDPDWEDQEDRTTANADFGTNVLKAGSSNNTTHVANLQRRLNYLGFNSGTVDGKFGANTTKAVKAAQQAAWRFGLTVDGKAGEETKEALRYPKAWFTV